MNSEPLSITFVIQKLLGLKGGAERIFLETAKEFQKRGHKVQILIYDNGQGMPAYDCDGLNIENLFPVGKKNSKSPDEIRKNHTPALLKKIPHFGFMGHLKWALTHGFFEKRLKAALRRKRPDIVVGFLPPAITASVRAANALKIPVIASTHNLPDEDFGNGPRWDQNPVYRKRARAALQSADAVTILQERFLDWFPLSMRKRVEILSNPVQRIAPPQRHPKDRKNIIIGVGRLTSVKRFDILIGAWVKIHREFPEWRIDIYGEGPCEGALLSQIDEENVNASVSLRGVSNCLWDVYDEAKILCHPSSFEGFGLVVAEAMAHGIPAIAFDDCPGANTLISNGIDGILVSRNSNEVEKFASELQQLLRSPKDIIRLGATASEITKTYPAEKIYNQWENLARKLSLH